MNGFLVLCGLLSVASARPDVSLGYKYPSPSGSGGSVVQHESQQSNLPNGLYAPVLPSSSLSGASSSITYPSVGYVPSVSSVSSSISGGHHAQYPPSYHDYHHQHQIPIVTKHFYLHSAPEEHADQVTRHITIGQPQKNYRVVFIKAPTSGAANARITASHAPTEEKTVIYVLSQKPEELQIDTVASPTPTEPSKPEVFFIKYKTPEEAAHAQQQIQAQYDALGGTSHVSNEGQAPVTSVVGILGGPAQHHHDVSGVGQQPGVGSSSSVSGTYLPSSSH